MSYDKGEIFLINLPSKNGKEQQGIRPGIVLADTQTKIIIVIPLTSNLNASKFYHIYKIKLSKENNLEKDSIALIFQIQSLDKKRLLKKIGRLNEIDISNIDNKIIKFFQLSNNYISSEKLKKYFSVTKEALAEAVKKISKGREDDAREIIDMVKNYLSDAHYFEQKNDLVDAFAAINYAHGWLDCGVRQGIFDVKNDKLFTVK